MSAYDYAAGKKERHEDRNRRSDSVAIISRGNITAQEDEPSQRFQTDPISRFLSAGIVGTYVRPHRHQDGKWELVSVLQGKVVDVILFSADGFIKNRVPLSPETAS